VLTLAGAGGAGKTRLALELARGAEPAYEAGAALVELAPLADARLVPDEVAAALDVRALAAQEPLDAVIDFLAPRTLLLVLDNRAIVATQRRCRIALRAAPD
jgi:non-specific serine/threonine protein kinase